MMVTSAGFLYTAGRNDSAGGGGHGSPPVKDAGQLGRGGAMDAFGRVPIPNDEPIVQCAAGRYHSCALTKSGKIVTFGLNDRGQLGRHGTYGVTDGDGCVCDSGGSCACDAVAAAGKEGSSTQPATNASAAPLAEAESRILSIYPPSARPRPPSRLDGTPPPRSSRTEGGHVGS